LCFVQDLCSSSLPFFNSIFHHIKANGSSFSAGADLNWMKKMHKYTKEQNEEDSHRLFEMFYAIRNCRLPVIGRINGAALGGGSGLVACCDVALALSGAKFGFTEVKLGLIPAVISPFVLEKMGGANCSRYFLTGQRFDAAEARRVGLVQAHFESVEALDTEIDRITTEIGSSGPAAVERCKQLLRKVQHMNVDDPTTKLYVAEQIAVTRVSPEAQDGLGAFLNKQSPPWVPVSQKKKEDKTK
jgi:methylglutaconyl-CoA hydratase